MKSLSPSYIRIRIQRTLTKSDQHRVDMATCRGKAADDVVWSVTKVLWHYTIGSLRPPAPHNIFGSSQQSCATYDGLAQEHYFLFEESFLSIVQISSNTICVIQQQ